MDSLLTFIKQLRRRPESARRRLAFMSAGVLTAAIILLLSPFIGVPRQAEMAQAGALPGSPMSTVVRTISELGHGFPALGQASSTVATGSSTPTDGSVAGEGSTTPAGAAPSGGGEPGPQTTPARIFYAGEMPSVPTSSPDGAAPSPTLDIGATTTP